jgi:chorismate mutase/prephenate dehydratase
VAEELKHLRDQIDEVDVKILELFNRRMELALQVGRLKARCDMSLFDPGREEMVLQHLLQANPGPLSESSLRAIYREVFAASRLLQYVFKVAYLGPEWTYSHLAALSLYGHSAQYLGASTLEDVFEALQKRKAHVAVVPIENSLQGGVGKTIDLLYEREVQVIGECYLEVAHCLCTGVETLGEVRNLYAHAHSMEQCRRWVLETLRHAQWHECTSTAQAAQLAVKDPAGAAICNLYAAHHYGLRVLAERIEDHAGNTTRFFALGEQVNPPTGNDKTAILFAVSDQPGALCTALESFARARVNLTRIESRPKRLFPWQYLFYTDVEGHCDEDPVRSALEALREHVTFLKILGSYPKGDPKQPIRLDKEKMRQAEKLRWSGV